MNKSYATLVFEGHSDNPRKVILDSRLKYIGKLSDYLYLLRYSNIDYSYGKEWVEKRYKPALSGCSSVRSGNFFGRNLDWYYNNDVDVVVVTEAGSGRYATIGVSSSVSDINKRFMERENFNNDIFAALPFTIVDGINEKGVFINTNVVALEEDSVPTTGTVPTVELRDRICMSMLARYILDKFETADEAIDYITKYISVYANSALSKIGYEAHFLLGDSTKTYAVEFVNNALVYREVDYITNFYVNEAHFNNDNGVYTPETQDETHDAMATNNIQPHGQGLERWNVIAGEYSSITGKDSIVSLMKDKLNYNKAYSTSDSPSNPYWYTEFTGGDLKVNSDVDDFAEVVEKAGKMFTNRDRSQDKKGVWHTTHTSVYDLKNKVLFIYDSSEDGVEHQISLDFRLNNIIYSYGTIQTSTTPSIDVPKLSKTDILTILAKRSEGNNSTIIDSNGEYDVMSVDYTNNTVSIIFGTHIVVYSIVNDAVVAEYF